MPLYEYECDDCGHRFERIRKFSDPPLTTCPECDGPIRKLLSPPAIQFKGTGWYVTDYARKPGDGKPAEGGGEAGKDAGAANGSDAKPSGESRSSADGKSGDGPKSGSESKPSGAGASSGSGSGAKPGGSGSSSASSSAPG
ncbi:MAG: FmdB family transcriptional regulator [Acidobacteria bacterium]|nr:FmdB family transcriptional regulator [Acidobacteriota bacterium]